MSYARAVVLWCNARDLLPSGKDFGCYAEFELPPGQRFEPLAKVRRAAKEAGWAYVRDAGSIRALDKDLCPKHNPDPPAAEPARPFAGAPLPDHVTELDEGAYLIEMPGTEADR